LHGEVFTQLRTGAMKDGLDGTQGHPAACRNLLMRQPAKKGQGHELARLR
jgi:hypothetical protein